MEQIIQANQANQDNKKNIGAEILFCPKGTSIYATSERPEHPYIQIVDPVKLVIPFGTSVIYKGRSIIIGKSICKSNCESNCKSNCESNKNVINSIFVDKIKIKEGTSYALTCDMYGIVKKFKADQCLWLAKNTEITLPKGTTWYYDDETTDVHVSDCEMTVTI